MVEEAVLAGQGNKKEDMSIEKIEKPQKEVKSETKEEKPAGQSPLGGAKKTKTKKVSKETK